MHGGHLRAPCSALRAAAVPFAAHTSAVGTGCCCRGAPGQSASRSTLESAPRGSGAVSCLGQLQDSAWQAAGSSFPLHHHLARLGQTALGVSSHLALWGCLSTRAEGEGKVWVGERKRERRPRGKTFQLLSISALSSSNCCCRIPASSWVPGTPCWAFFCTPFTAHCQGWFSRVSPLLQALPACAASSPARGCLQPLVCLQGSGPAAGAAAEVPTWALGRHQKRLLCGVPWSLP